MHKPHDVEDVDVAKLPVGQSVQADCPAAEYLPHAQSLQGAPPEVATPFLPAVHAVQKVEPVLLAYVPRVHEVQEATKAPSSEYVPAGQAVHEPEPAAE